MVDPAQAPAASAADSAGMSTLTKVLIAVGVIFVLFIGGCAACAWYVGGVVGNAANDLGADLAAAADDFEAGAAAAGDSETDRNTAAGDLGANPTTAAEDAETPFGRSTLDDLADWVLLYPGADFAGGNVVVDTDGLSGGAYVMLADDPPADVFTYYEEQLRAAGYEVTRQTTGMAVGGGSSGILMGQLADSGRTFNVIVSEQGGRTHINTQYQERAQGRQ